MNKVSNNNEIEMTYLHHHSGSSTESWIYVKPTLNIAVSKTRIEKLMNIMLGSVNSL